MAKKHISKKDYHCVIGLLDMAKTHTDALLDIKGALMDITGEEEEYGFCSDAVYDPYADAKGLLKTCGLKVKK